MARAASLKEALVNSSGHKTWRLPSMWRRAVVAASRTKSGRSTPAREQTESKAAFSSGEIRSKIWAVAALRGAALGRQPDSSSAASRRAALRTQALTLSSSRSVSAWSRASVSGEMRAVSGEGRVGCTSWNKHENKAGNKNSLEKVLPGNTNITMHQFMPNTAKFAAEEFFPGIVAGGYLVTENFARAVFSVAGGDSGAGDLHAAATGLAMRIFAVHHEVAQRAPELPDAVLARDRVVGGADEETLWILLATTAGMPRGVVFGILSDACPATKPPTKD